jgi:hypothetical protein
MTKPRKPHVRKLLHLIAFADPEAQKHKHAKKTLKKHQTWFSQKNVVGLCISRKLAGSERTKDISLQVLVRKKRPAHRLSKHQLIPGVIQTDMLGIGASIITDVLEVGDARLESLATASRPLFPGFSVGHRFGGSGTLGCAVRSLESNQLLGLSCAHVVALSGEAPIGTLVLAPARDEALALHVLSRARFGRLKQVGQLKTGFENALVNVDAATFSPNMPGSLGAAMAVSLATPTGVLSSVREGMAVTKVGARTRQTSGTVVATDVLTSLPYPLSAGTRDIWFSGLIGISQFTADGDSGALVMDSGNHAVGLHIGSNQGMSLAIPIKRVLDAMNSSLA